MGRVCLKCNFVEHGAFGREDSEYSHPDPGHGRVSVLASPEINECLWKVIGSEVNPLCPEQ